MSKQNDFTSIGQVYGDMLNGIKRKLVSEGKKGPRVKLGQIGDALLLKGGPQETAGYNPNRIERSKKSGDDNLYNINNLSQPDDVEECEECDEEAKVVKQKKKICKESKKIVSNSINKFMRKKSIFDKLYENVMSQPGSTGPMDSEMDDSQELSALGIDDEGDSEGMEEEGGGDVTITLDRETAQKLCDMIQSAMGGDDLDSDLGDDLDSDLGDDLGDEPDDKEEDEQGFWDEDEEDLGANNLTKEVNYGKNNKVGSLKTQGGTATSAYTDKVGSDGDHGHALVNAKQPNMGKSNKVGGLKTGKSMFEQ